MTLWITGGRFCNTRVGKDSFAALGMTEGSLGMTEGSLGKTGNACGVAGVAFFAENHYLAT